MKWLLSQVSDAIGASLSGGDGRAAGYSIDTRTIRHGEVFFAIRAERDGHEFVEQAFEQGASAAVVAWDWAAPAELADKALLRVADPKQSLADLARAQRQAWGGPMLAVTGSGGKTTVKESAAAMLASKLRTAKTEGNLNNELGVPLTLLAIDEAAEAAVVEMGMNHAGEIRNLARIAEPNFGLVTNVSAAHIGAFDSVEGVALAKRELVEELGPAGTAILNADDPRVKGFADVHAGQSLSYSVDGDADFQAVDIRPTADGGSRFRLLCGGEDGGVELSTALPGRHNVSNLTGAAAAAMTMGVEAELLADAIRSLGPGKHRGETLELGDITVIDDCYNSNPAAVRAMLTELEARPARRRVAVLGEMRELGELSEALHRETGEAVAASGVDLVVAVGQDAKWIAESAQGSTTEALWFADSRSAGGSLQNLLQAGDVVLLKGSRGVQLEAALDKIRDAFGCEAAVGQGAE